MGGWGRRRREVQKGGGICIHIADSLHCTAETNNIVKKLYPIKKGVKSIPHFIYVLTVYFKSSSRVSLQNISQTIHSSDRILLMDFHLTWRKQNLKSIQCFTRS